jgi:hypothetical protein
VKKGFCKKRREKSEVKGREREKENPGKAAKENR